LVRAGGPAAGPAAGPRGFQAFEGAFADEVGGHLVHGGDDVEQEPSGRGGGVDALFEHDQVDAALVECGGEFGHVPHRAEWARERGDY
jgi:hypothetical protein